MPIYRNKKRGRLVFEFDRYVGGRRIRATKTLPKTWTQAQADAFDRRETDRLCAIAQGVGPEPDIEAAVECYLTGRIPELKAGAEITRELALIYVFYRGRPLSALPDVCKAIALKGKGTLAPATIKKRIRYLCSACRYAWKHADMGQHDPAERVAVPQVRNERQVYTDRAGMLTICRACPDRKARAAIRIAFYTGLRLSELHRAQRQGDLLVLLDTKNGEPRAIPIDPRIRAAARVKLHSASYTSQLFRKARTAAGMPNFHFHDLRHAAASEMINAGVDLYTVGAVLGHKSAASTQRYAHLKTALLSAALGKIGRRAA